MEYVDISIDMVSKALEKEMAFYTDKTERCFTKVDIQSRHCNDSR